MEQFRFVLSRVLEWYEKEFQLEENRLADCQQALSKSQQSLEQVRALRLHTEQALIGSSSIAASDLRALEQFRRRSLNDEKRLHAECDACQTKLQAKIKAVKLAQRKVRLLEKVRERRQTEHTYAVNRELEHLAADSYLAKFNRER